MESKYLRLEDISEAPELITVNQAAEIIQCSSKRVYQYIDEGRLSARKFGHQWALSREEVQKFQPGPSGRMRSKEPPWHVYRGQSKLFMTTIEVPIRPGMYETLREKLKQAEQQQTHTFTANVARYICEHGKTLRILLLWKNTEMPDETTRQRDLHLFQQEFADVLDWETADYSFDDVLLHT